MGRGCLSGKAASSADPAAETRTSVTERKARHIPHHTGRGGFRSTAKICER